MLMLKSEVFIYFSLFPLFLFFGYAQYSRPPLPLDVMYVCSAAGDPRLLEGKMTPASAGPSVSGLSKQMPPAPLGYECLPPERDNTQGGGSGIRLVDVDDDDRGESSGPSSRAETAAARGAA